MRVHLRLKGEHGGPVLAAFDWRTCSRESLSFRCIRLRATSSSSNSLRLEGISDGFVEEMLFQSRSLRAVCIRLMGRVILLAIAKKEERSPHECYAREEDRRRGPPHRFQKRFFLRRDRDFPVGLLGARNDDDLPLRGLLVHEVRDFPLPEAAELAHSKRAAGDAVRVDQPRPSKTYTALSFRAKPLNIMSANCFISMTPTGSPKSSKSVL